MESYSRLRTDTVWADLPMRDPPGFWAWVVCHTDTMAAPIDVVMTCHGNGNGGQHSGCGDGDGDTAVCFDMTSASPPKGKCDNSATSNETAMVNISILNDRTVVLLLVCPLEIMLSRSSLPRYSCALHLLSSFARAQKHQGDLENTSFILYVWSYLRGTPHVWLGSTHPRSQCLGGMLLVQWCHKLDVLNCLMRNTHRPS